MVRGWPARLGGTMNAAGTVLRPHRRLAAALIVSVVGAGVMQAAVAAPKSGGSVPKYYQATAAPELVPLPVASTATVTITLTNCNPCGTNASTQPFGSAQIRYVSSALDAAHASVTGTGWNVGTVPGAAGQTVLQLTNSGTGTTDAIPPAGSVVVTVPVLSTATAGEIDFTTQVKQSNDFSGTGNDFGRVGADPVVYIGSRPATHLQFGVQPTTIQGLNQPQTADTTPILGTCASVRALDALGNLATSFSGTVALTPSDSQLGLQLNSSNTVARAAVNGVASFGSGDCSNGLSATKLGFGYTLTASSTGVTSAVSNAFNVLQFYVNCSASCSTPSFKGRGTTGSAQAQGTTTDTLTFDVDATAWAFQAACNPDFGATDVNPQRAQVTIDLNAHSKTVTLLWSKQAVQWAINNGASQWRVCMAATYPFHAVDGAATAVGAFYVGALLPCGSPAVVATADPCLQKLNKSGGQQQAVVFIPNVAGDPRLF